MTTFKVPCPSCEAKVLIKNPNLIGTKVECPKCKYRFKVEEPKDAPAEAAKAETPADEGKKAAGKAKSKKKLVAAGLAVLGIVLLAVGGYAIFGGEEKKPTPPANRGGGVTPGPYAGGPGGGTPGEDPNKEKDKGKEKAPEKPKRKDVAYSDKDSTNLLPGGSVAVYRFDIDRIRLTPIGNALFDSNTAELLKRSTQLEADNVETYFHCIVGEKERAPIGLIRLKDAMLESEIKIAGAGKAKAVKGKNLVPVKDNAFFTAIGQSMAGRSLFGDVYEAGIESKGKDFALGVCIYDSQHIFVGDFATLESFLNGLKDGYPEFQTVYKKDSPAPPPPPTPGTGGPGGPPMPGTIAPGAGGAGAPPAPGTIAPGAGGAGAPPTPGTIAPGAGGAGAPPAPGTIAPGAGGAAPPSNKDYTSNPSYLSVSTDLKKLLNAMEDEHNPPAIVLAEKFNNEAYPRKGVKKDYAGIAKAIDPVLDRTAYIGMNLTSFSPRQCAVTIRIIGKSADAAKQIAIEQLTPALNDTVPILSLLLDTNIVLRNYADPNGKPPGSEYPGGGIGFPPPGGPMGPKPGGPLGGGSAGGPPPGLGGPGPGTGGPVGGGSAGGPPPGLGGPGGPPPGGPPPGTGGPGLGGPPPGTGGPGFPPPPGGPGPGGPPPGGPGVNQNPTTPVNPDSQIDLRLVDATVTISVTINWTEEVYGRFIVPRLFAFANQVKGKTSVFAGGSSWNGLATAVTKYVEANKRFPAGTIPRPPSDPARLGLQYPPIQRLSFFAELLPYLGRGNLRATLVDGTSWFDASNLATAESWVPEFLVPYYEQSAWRATSTLAPDRVLGGTNFVAIAGVGRDAARYNPKNPAQEKLVGLSGYDWGSPVAEVTDGLENTIYLMQVPPEFPRPWAAGGGATVLGLDPTNPMGDFKHLCKTNGKWGTFAIMGDGVVRWIPADIKPSDLLALATRAGGEKLSGGLDAIAPRVDGKATTELKAEPKPPVETKTETAAPKKESAGAKPDTAPPPKAKQ